MFQRSNFMSEEIQIGKYDHETLSVSFMDQAGCDAITIRTHSSTGDRLSIDQAKHLCQALNEAISAVEAHQQPIAAE
jgi:hypothetical protein